MRGRLGVDLRIGEEALDGRLRVIKVTVDADRVDILISGCRHLKTLNLRRARRGIKDENLGSLHTRETLHRRRARVTRRCRQDENAPPARRMPHQDGQHRERDVLKRARPTVEEFEKMKAVLLDERNGVFRREAREEAVNGRGANRGGQVIKERTQDTLFGGAQRRHGLNTRKRRDLRRDEEPAVGRKPLEDRLSTRRRNPRSR